MAERSARLIDQVFPGDLAAVPPENPVLMPTVDVGLFAGLSTAMGHINRRERIANGAVCSAAWTLRLESTEGSYPKNGLVTE